MIWALLAVGCSTDPEPTIDGWEVARDFLRTDAKNCHAGILAYCDPRPEFIDPILHKVLDQGFHGVMPTTARQARAVARRAVASYRDQQTRTEAARAQLKGQIEEYYRSPIAVDTDGVRRVVVGVVPGEWEKRGKGSFTMVPTDRWDGADWSVAEVARFAERLSGDGVSLLELTVSLPSMGGAAGYDQQVWRYSRSTKRLSLSIPHRPTVAWYTDRITSWADFRANAAKLTRADLHYCSLVDKNWNEDDACPL